LPSDRHHCAGNQVVAREVAACPTSRTITSTTIACIFVSKQEHATPAFYTIGHSTRPLADFVALLERSAVELVVDVRTVPRSRTNPQYDREALGQSLRRARLGYEALSALGGLRRRQPGIAPETNAFWDNESFHNYADYAMSAAFRDGLALLRTLGGERCCAIMCAEAVWWRCHRRIIADYLLHEGEAVFHIVSPQRVEPARITPGARPGPDGSLVYPAPPATSA
jgi:uncharacterized protein (DUF488 family)